MIGHEEQQIQIPPLALVVNAGCVRQHSSYLIVAKLVRAAVLTANGDEIDCAEAPGEMRLVIEPFPNDTQHSAIISMLAIFGRGG